MTKRLSRGNKILFYMIMFCLPFVFTEALIRIYFAIQVGPNVLLYGTSLSRHQERFDPKGIRERSDSTVATIEENVQGSYFKYRPNQTLREPDEIGNTIDVRINSHGFRGKDFKTAKQAGVVRIVTLGSSSTFGFRDHDDQTYPVYMEEMLNNVLPRVNEELRGSIKEPIKAFEVINLGIPHLTVEQIYALFMNEALRLRPEVVTFYEGANNSFWSRPLNTATEKTKHVIKKVPLANQVFRELRYRLLSFAFLGILISERYGGEYLSNDDIRSRYEGTKEGFIANLQRIYDECGRHHIQFVVANQQTTSREARKEDRYAIHGLAYESEQEMVRGKLEASGRIKSAEAAFLIHGELMDAERQWTVANNVPYADVIKAMDFNRECLISYVHLNSAGNQIIAATIGNEILKTMTGKRFPSAAWSRDVQSQPQ